MTIPCYAMLYRAQNPINPLPLFQNSPSKSSSSPQLNSGPLLQRPPQHLPPQIHQIPPGLARIRIGAQNLQIANIAPVADRLLNKSAHLLSNTLSTNKKDSGTHQTSQVLTPRAPPLPDVEILEQHDKPNDGPDQRARPDQPPRPPEGLAPLEEPEGFLREGRDAASHRRRRARVLRRRRSPSREAIRWLIRAETPAERLRGAHEAHAQHEAGEEAAYVGEVVEAGEEAEDESDGDVEDDEAEVLDGFAARLPCVEEVEEVEGQDAEEGARGAGRGDAVGGEVAAEHEAEDAG